MPKKKPKREKIRIDEGEEYPIYSITGLKEGYEEREVFIPQILLKVFDKIIDLNNAMQEYLERKLESQEKKWQRKNLNLKY